MFGYPSSIPYTYERDPTQPNLWYIKTQVRILKLTVEKNLSTKEFATKGKLITPINACAYKVHFEALDGVQPRPAETIEDRE